MSIRVLDQDRDQAILREMMIIRSITPDSVRRVARR
jgi:hypothetical protein